MPRRQLTVRNKENEQPQSSTVTAHSSTKRKSAGGTVASKRSKTSHEEKDAEKENQPERSVAAPTSEPVVQPVVNEVLNISDEEDDEGGEIDYPPSFRNKNDQGEDHPTNKQYVVYPKANQPPVIVSKTARYWSNKYCKTIRHVYPDSYDLYIHADFSCYGELEIVENCLLDLTKAIFVVQQRVLTRTQYVLKPANKINYVLGFRRLEALTTLLENTDGISGIDDGERFYDIMRVIGACYVTILRGLLPKSMFKKVDQADDDLMKKLKKIAKQIPNFKQVLEQSLVVGFMFLSIADICSAYTTVLRMVYTNWVWIMEGKTIDLNASPTKGQEELWNALKQAVEVEKKGIDHGKKESFDFMNEVQIYKGAYGMGGDYHDISKWSKSERSEYSLSRYDTGRGWWF